MNPARFMEEISRWMDKNHDNKVDEKCRHKELTLTIGILSIIGES
jgi:hypothetical protein